MGRLRVSLSSCHVHCTLYRDDVNGIRRLFEKKIKKSSVDAGDVGSGWIVGDRDSIPVVGVVDGGIFFRHQKVLVVEKEFDQFHCGCDFDVCWFHVFLVGSVTPDGSGVGGFDYRHSICHITSDSISYVRISVRPVSSVR